MAKESKKVDSGVSKQKSSGDFLKSKKLKVVLASVAGVLLLGGAGFALYVKAQYNKPENVVAKAFSKYAFSSGDRKFDSVIEFKSEDASSPVSSVELKMGVETAGKSTQIELEANLSVFRIRGAVQANENGNIYVQLKDLPALLGSGVTDAYGLPAEMKNQIAALDSKWIEITKEDLKSLTAGQTESNDTFGKCMDSVYAAMENKELGETVDKFYMKNRFVTAKSSNEEVVDGKKLLKVEVGLDKEKLDAFGKQLVQEDAIKKLASDCGVDKPDSSTSQQASEAKDALRNTKVYAWVNRGKKELVKLEVTGDNYSEQGTKTGSLSFKMDVKEPSGKIEAPTEVVNIKELMQMFGVDPSMLSGASSAL